MVRESVWWTDSESAKVYYTDIRLVVLKPFHVN